MSHTDPDRHAITDLQKRDIIVITVDVTGDVTRKTALLEQFKDNGTIYQLIQVSTGESLVDFCAQTSSALFGSRTLDQVPVQELGLSVRTYNFLRRNGVRSIGDLVLKSEQQLRHMVNIGQKSINEIKLLLGEYDLQLRQPVNS